MHVIIKYIIVVLILINVYACKDSTSLLNIAENLMETAPDSALILLKTTKLENFYLPSDKALYALLYCQALDKNEIPFELDSLISIATKYYDYKEPERATKAWYYSSRCAYYRNDNEEQANALIKANQYAQFTTNLNIKALIYSNKAELHEKQHQIDSSLLYYEKAKGIFLKQNDLRNAVICYLHIGMVLSEKNKLKDAEVVLLKANKISIEIKDTLLISTSSRSLSSLYRKTGQLDKAKKLLLNMHLTNSEIYNYNTYYLTAKLFLQENNIDSAYIFLNKIDTAIFYYPDLFELWKEYYFKTGRLLNALKYSEKVSLCKDSTTRKSLKESFAGLEKKYNYQQLKLSNSILQLKNSQKGILILIILLLFSGIIIGFLYWSNKLKHKQLKTEKALLQQEILRRQQEHENSILLENQLKFQTILLSNIEQFRINSLKISSHLSNNSKAHFLDKKDSFYPELITFINLEYNNITKRLIKMYPLLTENDIHLCCLLLANFDSGTIATIMNIKIESITKLRYRLRSKLNLKNTENLIGFLREF